MKKLLAVIPIATLIILLFNEKSAFAVGYPGKPLSEYNNIIVYWDITYNYYFISYTDNNIICSFDSNYNNWKLNFSDMGYEIVSKDLEFTKNYLTNNLPINLWTRGGNESFYCRSYLEIIKGSISGELPDFAIYPEPPEEPSWWDILKENAQRVIRDVLQLVGVPIDAAIDLDNWLSDLFTVKVGEGEDSLANQINTEPLPTPTPTPTPIPYQTVMTPDNNGGFTIQYIYPDPSGTPTAHPQPPSNNITNNYGSDFEYPYYENPENKDNPFQLKIPWYLKLILNNNDIPIETLDDHYLVAQNQIQSDDVLDAIDTVYNGFQVIPTDWLLLLGAIACLPVFASLISRMLNG